MFNNGRLTFTDGRLHTIKYTVTDVKGNKSTLTFNVQTNSSAIIATPENQRGVLFSYQKTAEYNAENVKVMLPQGTLYNDLNFIYKTTAKPAKNAFSNIHTIHNNLTPLHTGFSLWIRPDSNLSQWKDKAVIVNVNRSSQGGIFEDGWIKATPKVFGSYFVAIDTIAPTIIPVNIIDGKNLSEVSKIAFRISDNLSGIKSFNGYIDNNWVLFEFDAKSANLWHTFDGRIKPGKHSLELVVEDMKGNVKKYSAIFSR
ncbi:MAG: hypothetical protein EOO43_19790 [Flavobacterium sp.]|nr:MAG: hypothetical protein EOO43_19790 [Flavobacterium sp.]